ncbi:MAG: SAVED domain-containing protein [Pseudomonadota bacterium]
MTDAKGMGGIVAQDGFDYQVWDALVRLPAWLRNPGFEGFIVEGLEDVEARFFAPHAPRDHLVDRFQSKSGVLNRSGLIEVFESFQTFEIAHPTVARVQTLVTPALPPTLTWLARDSERVSRARPFYAPFADISAASDEKLRTDIINEFGADLGDFIAQAIEVSFRPISDRNTAEAAFIAALQKQFPDLDISARKLSAAFAVLNDLAAQARGSMLTRAHLLGVLRDVLSDDLVPHRHILAVHVRSDRNGTVENAIEIDASSFSGSLAGFPETERWHTELINPLITVSTWARKHGFSRVALSGSYRLSTAFSLGWAFRSAIGFEIDIPTRTGGCATDVYPAPSGSVLPWSIELPNTLVGDRLLVGVGILRDPALDILSKWPIAKREGLLLATLPQALANDVDVQASVRIVKAAIGEAVARLRPDQIDLCYVGPAAFAVALGHRWNALPPTQLYEFVATDGSYNPTALIG